MKRSLALGLALLAATLSLAQTKAEPIEADRPSFTNGPAVVPRGRLQVESGLTYQSSRGAHDLSGPEAVLRYGLREDLELRLGLPDYNLARIGERRFEGFGDTYVGAKVRLGAPFLGFDVGLIPGVFLPSGRRGFTSGTVDPELQVCLSRSLGGPWSLGVMEYGFYSGERFAFQQTAVLGRELGRGLDAFVEYAGTFARDGRPDHVAHIGVTHLLTRDSQVDIHGGQSLVGDPRPFVGAGYSVRF